MKKISFKSSKWLLPVVFLTLLGLAACGPDDDYNDNLSPMRMFMPGGVISSASGVEQVQLSWRTPANTQESNVTYTVEVAMDSLFQNPVMVNGAIFSAQTETNEVVFTDEQLQVQQRYYARVKSNAIDNRPESNWLYSSRFMIRGVQILQTPARTEITDDAIVIRWAQYPQPLTRVTITPLGVTGATPREILLTEENRTSRMVEVSGLEPSTSYRIELFQSNILRGYMTVRTISGLAGTIVDLTTNTAPGALMTAIANATSGSTIVLAKGATYNISTTTLLDKSITIMSELSTDPRLAVINFTSNFNIAAASAIDSVVFRDVVMRSDNYTSRYVFNITNGGTIGKIKFDGTRTEIFRGVVRLQTGVTTLNRFEIVNSVVDSIADFGILNVSAASRANNILFRNSTFYKIERGIVSASPANSILIDNCTFNEAPAPSRYIIDYVANVVSGGIVVQNSIFGIGKASGPSRIDTRGIRAGGTITSSGTYVTSDNVLEAVAVSAIPGAIPYTRTSFQLFRNPKNGDFTLIDPTFAGINTAGDPRWRP